MRAEPTEAKESICLVNSSIDVARCDAERVEGMTPSVEASSNVEEKPDVEACA
jgi:hypothetical protein